jgi:hypothetical protein
MAAGAAVPCVVVVVVVVVCEVAGGESGVAVALDCVVFCAITGKDIARTTSEPRTAANNFLDFIQLSFVTMIREYPRAPSQFNLCKVDHSNQRSTPAPIVSFPSCFAVLR